MLSQLLDQILPIVVLYNQKLEDSLTFQSLGNMPVLHDRKMEIFVYDNSPEPQYAADRFERGIFNIKYVSDISNAGIGVAYNTGAVYAKENNKKWLLLLDQDTILPGDFLSKTALFIERNPSIKLFVPVVKLNNDKILSPAINKHKRGYQLNKISEGKYELKKLTAINSGMLIALDSFYAVGGYNPKIKLDFCDFQFLEKYSTKFNEFFVTNAVCIQNFSGFELSKSKQISRFLIYLEDARNCDKPSIADKLGFFYTVSRHAFALATKLKEPLFLSLYLKNFLFK